MTCFLLLFVDVQRKGLELKDEKEALMMQHPRMDLMKQNMTENLHL